LDQANIIQRQVLSNKDLDLPTQQELLAQFRCDEIATGVIETFNSSSKVVRKPIEGGQVIDGLGSLMRNWLSTALGEPRVKRLRLYLINIGKFDRDASRYHASVYQRKRQDLLANLHASLSPLFLGQLKNLQKTVAVKFAKDLASGLKEPGYDFAHVVQSATTSATQKFTAGAKGESLLFTPDCG
jgi:hypothetical protein